MFFILRPFLFNIDPETAHDLAIKSLKFNPFPSKMFEVEDEHMLNIELLGKNFPNPIGLAAGFDKSAEAYNSLLKLGFGFVEVGTVTPRKQYGNPKPRIFRLEDDQALINRLGFNNDGIEIIKNRIKSKKKIGILGVNIGPNKPLKTMAAALAGTEETKDDEWEKGSYLKSHGRSINDFCLGLTHFFDVADYITINISSPNTDGLRDFHDQEKLKDLLVTLNIVKKDNKTNIPLLLKVSPDIKENDIPQIIDAATKNNISGIVLTNTTNSNRDNLKSEAKKEVGGLSGEPLQQISTNMIKKFYKGLQGKIPIIGVGGVNSGKSAYEKIIAGASLLQLYTSFVYKGPSAAKDIKKELIQILKTEGLNSIKEAIGKGA
jgi:dihydroorotate dehydrogenase